MEAAVKVAGTIITGFPGDILKQRSGMDQSIVERHTVDKRFKYRSRGSDRIHHIHMAEAGVIVNIHRTDPAAHFHIGMIHDDHRQ